MVWYLISIILMSYPILELSKLIWQYYTQVKASPLLIMEFILMWVSFLAGIAIIARHWE